MEKVAFVFPGQGSQVLGMSKDIYETFDEIKNLHDKINDKLGFNLTKIMFEDENKLNLTEYTQPALVLASYSILFALNKEKPEIKPTFVAGHSLGEFSALVASESLSVEDAVWITNIRGKLMQEAVPAGKGAMAAIIGLKAKVIEETLKEIDGIVEIANYNSLEQTVISGEANAVEKAMEILKEKGAKKAVKLAVSVPAHSSMLKEKAVEFGKYIDELNIQDAKVPVVSNITATPINTAEEIKKELKAHFYSPVRWVQTVEFLKNKDIDTIIEIGPKKVLTGLIKRIDRSFNLINLESLEDIKKL
jgi:[acyl-carrier-protein] S-malonyltransferase